MSTLINTSSLATKYYACGRSTIRYSVTVGKPPIVMLQYPYYKVTANYHFRCKAGHSIEYNKSRDRNLPLPQTQRSGFVLASPSSLATTRTEKWIRPMISQKYSAHNTQCDTEPMRLKHNASNSKSLHDAPPPFSRDRGFGGRGRVHFVLLVPLPVSTRKEHETRQIGTKR